MKKAVSGPSLLLLEEYIINIYSDTPVSSNRKFVFTIQQVCWDLTQSTISRFLILAIELQKKITTSLICKTARVRCFFENIIPCFAIYSIWIY